MLFKKRDFICVFSNNNVSFNDFDTLQYIFLQPHLLESYYLIQSVAQTSIKEVKSNETKPVEEPYISEIEKQIKEII